MEIFEIIQPGCFAVGADGKTSTDTVRISLLVNSFYDANFAYILFHESMQKITVDSYQSYLELRQTRIHAIHEEIRKEKGIPCNSCYNWDEIQFLAERQFNQERLASGLMPSSFQNKNCIFYANAFVFYLDRFDKLLDDLKPTKADNTDEWKRRFKEAFPDLRGVRDSSQHIDNRIKQKGRKNRDIDLKPVTGTPINISGTHVLVMESLAGTHFCSTMGNGALGCVDITQESMGKLQKLLQDVLNAFSWIGLPMILPQ